MYFPNSLASLSLTGPRKEKGDSSGTNVEGGLDKDYQTDNEAPTRGEEGT